MMDAHAHVISEVLALSLAMAESFSALKMEAAGTSNVSSFLPYYSTSHPRGL
jgi:hypothetical protein